MPRYPFTPEYLDGLPEPLTDLFRELEQSLLEMICGRLASGRMNEVSVQAIRALRAHGIGLEEVERAVRETAGLGRTELERIIDDTVERNRDYYGQTLDFAGLTAPEYLVSPEDVEAIRRQTVDRYRNITGSMGFLVDGGRTMLPPARAYQWALDGAEMRIMSGAVSYEAAIRDAVRQLAGSGIKTAEYASGHVDQIDVAVRRAALTGVRQVNRRYTERAIEELGTDLVEVSAHIGARDVDGPNGWENHKAWQGRVYRLSTPDAIRAAGAGPMTAVRAEKTQLPVGTGAEMTRRGTGERGPSKAGEKEDSTAEPAVKQEENPPQYEDITGNWYPEAKPGSHEVLDAAEVTVGGITYKVDGRNVQLSYSPHEKEIAELLEREVGGELYMLPRVNNPQGVKTADYLFHGKAYDLKTLEAGQGQNKIFNRIKKSRDQAQNFIVDVTESGLEEAAINEQIKKVFRNKETSFVDEVAIISDGKIIKVVKRAKK